MGLRKCGIAKLSKSGKSLQIDLELPNTVFTYYLFIEKEGLEKVLAGRQYKTNVSFFEDRKSENNNST